MNAQAQVIMGIDPGLMNTGVAVICGDMYLHGQVLKTKVGSGSVLKRIQTIGNDVIRIIQTYNVKAISIERFAYHGHGVTTTASMNQLIGSFYLLTYMEPHPRVFTHDPLRWGLQLTGHPKRTKSDVAAVVNMRLGVRLTARAGGHLTDAIGLALVLQDQLRMRQEVDE